MAPLILRSAYAPGKTTTNTYGLVKLLQDTCRLVKLLQDVHVVFSRDRRDNGSRSSSAISITRTASTERSIDIESDKLSRLEFGKAV